MPLTSQAAPLRLEILTIDDANHWRWRLVDSAGKFLATHQVSLDPAEPEYGAFVDLEGYLERYAAPDKWPEDEERLLSKVGDWIGRRVFGAVATRLATYPTPATVRVVLPGTAAFLLDRPLELAHVGGRPLSRGDISLVYEVAGEAPAVAHRPVGDRLRMLAVFSLPTDASALALRRERFQLAKLVRELVQTRGLAIALRVVQYGVTRQALGEILKEGGGWDVLHFSGHGLTGGVLLEKPDGSQDLVTSDELVDLLRAARGQLKLVTLSACLTAAATIDETLHWLGIRPPAVAAPPDVVAPPSAGSAESPGEHLPAVARALVQQLDCAVLAMRYPVGDDFAIDLTNDLYERLFGGNQPLTRGLQLALPVALGGGSRPGVPPLSVATPALFGRTAANLSLRPPPAGATDFSAPSTGLTEFPPEPERFVGRIGPLLRASAALAPQSGKTVVLFHGMAGAGKSTCALELAYRHETGGFRAFVWHKAPDAQDDSGAEVEGALLNLALDMERQLPGFKMAHLVDQADEFARFQPRLRQVLQRNSILIVLDNLESLLTPDGEWLDERWGQLVATLLGHGGLSRTVLTSRIVPAELRNSSRVQREAIHTLSLSEAVLLARELPNLGRLLRGETPAGITRGRELVSRTLAVVQGHPKLIELAEGQAADPDTFATHVERAAAAWPGDESRLQGFFREGQSTLDAAEFLQALALWTRGVVSSLSDASRTLFSFICALEESDRTSAVLEATWMHLWRRLERPGEAPALPDTLAPLAAAGLVEVRPAGEGRTTYGVHPGVAETGRADAGDPFRPAVDAELAAYWVTVFRRGLEQELGGGGRIVATAGRSAAPYLMRLEQWDTASTLLEQAMFRDSSPSAIASVLPLLRRIASSTAGTPRGLAKAGILAVALREAGHLTVAEAQLRSLVRDATEHEQFGVVSAAMGDLINVLMDTGRAEEALGLIDERKQATVRAGFGSWTQLGNEVFRLQLLVDLGENEAVLTSVDRLREQMRDLPEESGQEERVPPWNVRETLLGSGRSAAALLGRWELALELNAEIATSKEARGASAVELARARFNDYAPLLRLGRFVEARALLDDCRSTFERERDVEGLGLVFGALAELESNLGYYSQATAFEETCLRLTYMVGNPDSCATSHHNLSNYLRRIGYQANEALAHRLASALITYQTGSGLLPQDLRNLQTHLSDFEGREAPLPPTFDALCGIVEQVEGVRFRELFEGLPRRAANGDEALRAVLGLVQRIGETGDGQRPVAPADPVASVPPSVPVAGDVP